ncbi:MAG: 4-(cytidine 5'-diphospho)-2-C-methyl-D-erythritol kinase [Lachnospiraceae bacterium]|nr:4-(cytidine 5'-diphospho)-2-C-methyl-D-erythritol kinase [Lachnospiraceae bacterium]
MTHTTMKSYAKINLGLDVLDTLPNGYHSLKMIMQTISLHDTLYFEKRKKPSIILKANLPYLPTNEKNIVYQAIRRFKETMKIYDGIFCTITKHIPVAAGMAGGSGNAAAALKAMDLLYGTHLTTEQLCEMGVKLGADVPYCITGGTALAEGIGDILTPLPSPPRAKVLIVKPSVSVSTGEVYKNLRLDESTVHPDIDSCISAIKEGSLKKLCDNLGNVLEDVTVSLHPVISEIKTKMKELGADGTLMSGSGPTVFGLFEDDTAAQTAFEYYSGSDFGKSTFLCDFT